MKTFFAMFMLALAAIGILFTSCSSEDDPVPEPSKYHVVGTWTFTDVKIGEEYEKSNGNVGYALVLKADGTLETTLEELDLQEARYEYDREDTITIKGKLEWHDGTTVETTRTIVIVSLKNRAFEIKMKGKYIEPTDPDTEYQSEHRGVFNPNP